jgi:DNA-directed RNA polymerase specialized sigma24 family protein
VLGCSKSTMQVRLHRARKRLEVALARVESEHSNTATQEVLP